MIINKLSGAPPVAAAAPPSTFGATGFKRQPTSDMPRPAPVQAYAVQDILLLLQEQQDTPARDRRARSHGRQLLDLLARLQVGLLTDTPTDSAMQQLAALIVKCPDGSDPALQDALAQVALRVRVELAKRGSVTFPPQYAAARSGAV